MAASNHYKTCILLFSVLVHVAVKEEVGLHVFSCLADGQLRGTKLALTTSIARRVIIITIFMPKTL